MSDSASQTYRSILLAGIFLALSGAVGLVLLFATTLPTLGPRWLFFFLVTLAVAGAAMPLVWLLNTRFASRRMPTPGVLVREAIWVALFVDICLWLQINRSLTLSVMLLVAAGLVVLEALWRTIEYSLWKPGR